MSLTPSRRRALVRGAVASGRLERARTPRSLAERLEDPARARGAARGRRREQAARHGRPRHRLAQRLHPAHEPVPRPLRVLHVREDAATRPRRRPTRSTRWRTSCAGGVRHGLHRGALLPRRQARDRLPRAPRVARGARATAAPPSTWSRPAGSPFEGGMLPHTNAGILTQDEMARLRRWNASMGLMLETTSPRLRGKGMAHQYAPDKEPGACGCACTRRRASSASRSRPASCSGSARPREERVDTLLAIRALHDQHGHIQEAIVQPFHPKPGTTMRWASPLPDRRGRGLGRARAPRARPRRSNVQAPPNLAPDAARAAAARRRQRLGRRLAGDGRLHQPRGAVADAAPSCARRTEAAGQRWSSGCRSTREHLARPEFFEPARARPRRSASQADGWLRARPRGPWRPPDARTTALRRRARRRRASSTPRSPAASSRAPRRAPARAPRAPTSTRCCAPPTSRARRTRATTSPTSSTATSTSRTSATWAAASAASRATRDDADAYDRGMEEILAKAADAHRARRDRGLHPGRHRPEEGPRPLPRAPHDASRREFPELHLHAFSPEEIDYGHKKSGMPLASTCCWLEGRRPRHDPRHRRRDPRRLDARRALAAQAQHRALGRDREHRARRSACARPRRSCTATSRAAARGRATSSCCATSRRRRAASPSSCRSASSTRRTCSSTTWALAARPSSARRTCA